MTLSNFVEEVPCFGGHSLPHLPGSHGTSSALRRCFSASAWAARTCASKDSRSRWSSPSKSRSGGATTWMGSDVSWRANGKDMSLRLQVMMTITNNKQERTCKHSSVWVMGVRLMTLTKKGNDDSARMSWWEPKGKQPVGIGLRFEFSCSQHMARRDLLTIESFTMGCKVFTPVERIAGFSGKTIGTGSGNFWIICTTWTAREPTNSKEAKTNSNRLSST